MSYKSVPALGKDWLTPFYDVLVAVGGFGSAITRRVLERALMQDGEHVLDIGCATATRLIAAKARYPTAHLEGVDPDERALQTARKKIARHQVEVEVVQARAEHLPFPPASFDAVTSSLVFHHLPTEIKRQAIQDNTLGKLPLFLQEAGFAVRELPPHYRGVHFLLATKEAEAQGGRKA